MCKRNHVQALSAKWLMCKYLLWLGKIAKLDLRLACPQVIAGLDLKLTRDWFHFTYDLGQMWLAPISGKQHLRMSLHISSMWRRRPVHAVAVCQRSSLRRMTHFLKAPATSCCTVKGLGGGRGEIRIVMTMSRLRYPWPRSRKLTGSTKESIPVMDVLNVNNLVGTTKIFPSSFPHTTALMRLVWKICLEIRMVL